MYIEINWILVTKLPHFHVSTTAQVVIFAHFFEWTIRYLTYLPSESVRTVSEKNMGYCKSAKNAIV